MSEYRIELGVKLNTSEIRSQVSKYNGNSNNAKLKLGVKLDTKGISNQIRAINSKTPVKVSLKLDTKNAQSQINNIKKQIQQLGNIKINLGGSSVNSRIGSGQNVTQDTVNKLKKSYKELLTMANQISNLEAKIGKLKFAGNNTKQIEVLESKLKSLKVTYDSLANSFINKGALTSGVFDVGDLSNLNNAVNQGKIKLNELEAEYEDTRVKLARKLEINLQEGKFSAQVAKVNGDAKKLSSVTNELQQKLKALNIAEQSMNTAFKSGSVEQKIQSYNNYKRALESVRNQLKQNQIAEQSATNTVALNQAKQNLSLKMSNWLRDNSAATKQFGGEIKNLQAQLKKCGNMSTVNNVSKAFNNVTLQAKAAGVATQSLSDKLKTQFSKYSSYLSVASVFMYTTQALRSMFEQVKLIDSAMTELKKVTDETNASYDRFLNNAASRAKEIGTTIDGLVSSTADFARLGYSFKDSQGLAEVANIYAVVGDEVEGVEGATESLISTMAAFKDEAVDVSNTDFATSIIDKFNEIGNKFAISSGGIGEAMKRSASSLDAANNSIDESIALITAANTVVQNPDKVGRLLPTIKMAISVKLQRWTRPRKDFISIFSTYQLGRMCVFLHEF